MNQVKYAIKPNKLFIYLRSIAYLHKYHLHPHRHHHLRTNHHHLLLLLLQAHQLDVRLSLEKMFVAKILKFLIFFLILKKEIKYIPSSVLISLLNKNFSYLYAFFLFNSFFDLSINIFYFSFLQIFPNRISLNKRKLVYHSYRRELKHCLDTNEKDMI